MARASNGSIDHLYRTLSFLSCSNSEKKHPLRCDIMDFDGCIPMDIEGLDQKNIEFLLNDGNPAIWPLNISICHLHDDDRWAFSGSPRGSMTFYAAKNISFVQARSFGCKVFSPFMAAESFMSVAPNGERQTARTIWAYVGGTWVSAAPNQSSGYRERFELYLGVALTMRYNWSVWIGEGFFPKVRMFTDPRGSMELFKLRDVADGKLRRSALRNWVCDHWRANRQNDNEANHYVKTHLRGTKKFTWDGLDCLIQPPEFDERYKMIVETKGYVA